jgi:hypothetical protein
MGDPLGACALSAIFDDNLSPNGVIASPICVKVPHVEKPSNGQIAAAMSTSYHILKIFAVLSRNLPIRVSQACCVL